MVLSNEKAINKREMVFKEHNSCHTTSNHSLTKAKKSYIRFSKCTCQSHDEKELVKNKFSIIYDKKSSGGKNLLN